MHANRPLKDIACVLHAQTKDATVVCVIGCQITRTRIHTLPKRLASARHSRVRKLYSYQIHSARFKQTSQWRRKSWWCILPAALLLWHAGSDVMGCRRPTGGVFSYVSSDRVTLRAFPVATPRGRSVEFPWRGTLYLMWWRWGQAQLSDYQNIFALLLTSRVVKAKGRWCISKGSAFSWKYLLHRTNKYKNVLWHRANLNKGHRSKATMLSWLLSSENN